MAFYTDLANVHLNRPVKPIYGWTQATPQSWTLAEGETCFPGMLMTNVGNGEVRGAKEGEKVIGICSTFQEELTVSGSREVAVWVLTEAAVMEVEIRVTDPAAAKNWTSALDSIKDGEAQYVGLGADSKLTLAGESVKAADEGQGSSTTITIDPVYRLVDVIGTTAIQIAGL